MNTFIYANCMAGPYHIDEGLPCQDSYAYRENEEGMVFAAVADGLGSELYSEIGSNIAAKSVVDNCYEKITPNMEFSEIKKVMNNAMVTAYKEILEKAEEDGNSPNEYDTTLCLAVYNTKTNKLVYAQSGDSGIVALLTDGRYVKVTTQQRDGEGRVYPLCFGPEKWEFGEVSEVSALALMTDGVFEQICPKLLKNKEININVPLAAKFMDRFNISKDQIEEIQKASYEFLQGYPRYLLDDDKTIVCIINKDAIPSKQSEDYYRAPDWEGIMEEIEKRLHPDIEQETTGDDSVPSNPNNQEPAISNKAVTTDHSVSEELNDIIDDTNVKKN